MAATDDQLASLRATLLNLSGTVPLSVRFRSLFTLRSLQSDAAVGIIGEAFATASPLLGHELAYVLGQMGRESALPILTSILGDVKQHPMVRHEAGEAMGAISSLQSIPILQAFLNDSNVSVRETCELAIRKIEFDQKARQSHQSPSAPTGGFTSIDPAPPMSLHDMCVALSSSSSSSSPPPSSSPSGSGSGSVSEALWDVGVHQVQQMQTSLLDSNLSLFQRYRAMFGLRNVASEATDEQVQVLAVKSLAKGFGDASALFRHEIAYIFGQLCHPASVPSLLAVLRNKQEDEMVRHEAAEALGSIATPEVLPSLKEFAQVSEKSDIVRESCEVALDMYEYEMSGDLHYATPLHSLGSSGVQASVVDTA